MSVKSANGFGKPFGGFAVRLYRARVSVSPRNDFRSSKHHFGILPEVPIFMEYTRTLKNAVRFYPVQLTVMIMLKFRFLKEKNICDRLSSGCAECVLREPYATEEIRFSGQLTAE